MSLANSWSLSRKVFHPKLWKNVNILRSSSITKWNKDWKPGPYPRTEQERLAAAKKYNLIPEDYKPFPEEEGYGDYPDLPVVGALSRNPYECFDFPHLRKNYGEPLHADFDMYTPERLHPEERLPMSNLNMFLLQIGLVTFFAGLIWIGEKFPADEGYVPRQFPNQGITYYTFEPAEESE